MRGLFGILFLAIFGGLTYYVGLRGWEWVHLLAPQLSGWIYWLPFLVISLSFMLARFGGRFLPRPAVRALIRVGAYWLMIFLYAVLTLPLLDLAGWLLPAGVTQGLGTAVGTTVLLLLVGALLYGVWRARNVVVVNYEVTIAKPAGNHKDMHVVLVSDTHAGAINGNDRLRHMVGMVNELNPDLVLLCGDVMDDDAEAFLEHRMADELTAIKSRLGVFAVLGNHEYISGGVREYLREMKRIGIPVLVDEWVKVDDSFYVIGRDDVSARGFVGRPRRPLKEILGGVDPSLPLILMDHQPSRLVEAQQAGVDLLVAGHTHRGQMFPNQYITRRVFEVDWGYLKKGAMHVIVSLGFGTWGPPVRIGNRPEVVSIRVRFGEN